MNQKFALADQFLPDIAIVQADQSGALPEPDLVSYYKLENERCIFLDFDVDENLMSYTRMILRWNLEDRGIPKEQRKPIRIFIHSYGGKLDYCWNFIDMIQTSATPVYTINIGIACSAASLIFMAGEQRFMMPRATVLIHQGSASVSGDAIKVLDASESYKKELVHMKKYILERTEIPTQQMNKKIANDWELLADDCLKYKVCTAIISSLDEVIPQKEATANEQSAN